MATPEMDDTLINSYIAQLIKLSRDNRIKLISKLKESVVHQEEEKNIRLYSSFGKWEGDESADELIKSIRDSRFFGKK